MSARTVALPGLAWEAIQGSELCGGGVPWGGTVEELTRRTERSGYCFGLVHAVATPRVTRHGNHRSYQVYLTDEARGDLIELLEALHVAASQGDSPSEARAIAVALDRLRR